jgi:mono/diheme cytochrome c family protein
MKLLSRGPGLVIAVLLVFVLAFAAACGGDDDPDPTATTAAPAATATPEAADEGDDEAVEAGRQLAAQQCAACHTIDGSQAVGPTWQGLYGSEVELEDGSTVTADEEYIHESIVDPNAKIHADYPANVMPVYASTLSEEQIQSLIAFIRSLE